MPPPGILQRGLNLLDQAPEAFSQYTSVESYFPGGVERATPDQLEQYIYQIFLLHGHNPAESQFAVQVATGESSLNPKAVGDGGKSHGLWQLYEQGLLPAFYQWANESGQNPDPYDPVATTNFVAEYTKRDPSSWSNWSVARNLIEDGGGPSGDSGPPSAYEQAQTQGVQANTALTRDSLLSQQQDRRMAEISAQLAQQQFQLQQQQFQEQLKQNEFNRAADKMTIAQTTQQLADARRENAVDAMLRAAPFMTQPGTTFPHRAEGGPGQALGQLLGVNVAPTKIPTATLPLNRMVNAPQGAPLDQIEQQLGPRV